MHQLAAIGEFPLKDSCDLIFGVAFFKHGIAQSISGTPEPQRLADPLILFRPRQASVLSDQVNFDARTCPDRACKVIVEIKTSSSWLRRNIDNGNVTIPQDDSEGDSRIFLSGIPEKYLEEKFLLIRSRRK